MHRVGCTGNDMWEQDCDKKYSSEISISISCHHLPTNKNNCTLGSISLGLTFNWGVLHGWSTVKGTSNPSVCLPLYFPEIICIQIYNTAYAHQNKRNDALIGLKTPGSGLMASMV